MGQLKLSKYMSYILRHNPEEIGLQIQYGGWINTSEFLKAINSNPNSKYTNIKLEDIKSIVESDDKNRYSFKKIGDNPEYYIRANQGHSIKGLIMDYERVKPPDCLYHGTSQENAKKIIQSGALKPMNRQMVHLSADIDTAINVGKRHAKGTENLAILEIDCKQAIEQGITFFVSTNNVYLVDEIPSIFIKQIKI